MWKPHSRQLKLYYCLLLILPRDGQTLETTTPGTRHKHPRGGWGKRHFPVGIFKRPRKKKKKRAQQQQQLHMLYNKVVYTGFGKRYHFVKVFFFLIAFVYKVLQYYLVQVQVKGYSGRFLKQSCPSLRNTWYSLCFCEKNEEYKTRKLQ